MNEYKVVYFTKVRGMDFGMNHGYNSFEIILAINAFYALEEGKRRVQEYNEQQEQFCEDTKAIPDQRTVSDITRL